VNGVSLEGVWPGRRLAELTKDRPDLAKRWADALKQSHVMADAETVPPGTRYDALRMVALDSWDTAGPRLTRYLAKTAHGELQMGAVSGLADVEHDGATAALVGALSDLTEGNRKLAVAGLLRTPARALVLIEAIEKGTAKQSWLTPEQVANLVKHPDASVRARAEKVLKR
jgi:hypothetical protein